jgi:S1-C subfamily serine protease
LDAEIHVLSGARAGLVAKLSRKDLLLGRHPECDVQFHPALDLEVSKNHALLVQQGERWLVRDLESRNGTFVNGRRIYEDTLLWDADRVTLGRSGPTFEFRMVGLLAAIERGPVPAARSYPDLRHVPASGPPDSEQVRAAMTRQTRRLRWLSGALVGLLLTVIGLYQFSVSRQRAAWERERVGMLQQHDSLLMASEQAAVAIEAMLGELTAALRQSQEEVREVSVQLRRAEASGDRSQVGALRRRLEDATVALDRQQSVATLDFRGIERLNRPAIAKVYVEYDDGEVATATAFAVRPNATLLTSRHVVAGSEGARQLRRMAIQFSDSDQIWPARLLAVAEDADLALVKVDNIVGRVPTVRTLNLRTDTLSEGAPVAMIGFPLGGRVEGSNGQTPRFAQPLLSAGTLGPRRPHRIEIQGYGAAGASGSPIFDANREMIGVVFGGRHSADGGQTLFSVPSTVALRLLERIP